MAERTNDPHGRDEALGDISVEVHEEEQYYSVESDSPNDEQVPAHHHAHNKKTLAITLVIKVLLSVAEFVIGFKHANSLALLADAGHMLIDVAAHAILLIGMWCATRRPSKNYPYGLGRTEVVATQITGFIYFAVAITIIWQAVERIRKTPEVEGIFVIYTSAAGIFANLLCFSVTICLADRKNLSIRSALLDTIGDIIGSSGALIAGLLIRFKSLHLADPISSIVVAVIIFCFFMYVMWKTYPILMDKRPPGVKIEKVKEVLKGMNDDVIDVHAVHPRSINSDKPRLSCHIQITDEADHDAIRNEAIQKLKEHFSIEKEDCTIQVEKGQCSLENPTDTRDRAD